MAQLKYKIQLKFDYKFRSEHQGMSTNRLIPPYRPVWRRVQLYYVLENTVSHPPNVAG
jgi:hypothetical protein